MKRAGVLLGSIVLAGQCLAQVPGIETRQAQLIGPHGKPIGTVVLRGSANATIVRITVEPGGLTPGWHGVHFHATGDCSDVGEFMRARGLVDHVVKSRAAQAELEEVHPHLSASRGHISVWMRGRRKPSSRRCLPTP